MAIDNTGSQPVNLGSITGKKTTGGSKAARATGRSARKQINGINDISHIPLGNKTAYINELNAQGIAYTLVEFVTNQLSKENQILKSELIDGVAVVTFYKYVEDRPLVTTNGEVVTSGGYVYVAFKDSEMMSVNNFTVSGGNLNVEMLAVGGGGSGSVVGSQNGNAGGGGGGAGEVKAGGRTLAPSSYRIYVGAGGPGLSTSADTNGNSGQRTSINSVTSQGFETLIFDAASGTGGVTGASGGQGGNSGSYTGGIKTKSSSGERYAGGGGAGSSENGYNGDNTSEYWVTTGGNGGNGTNTYSYMTAPFGIGVDGYVAGGGGGLGCMFHPYNGVMVGRGGQGGLGGGTQGYGYGPGYGNGSQSAPANTGSGSGAGWNGQLSTSGNGGSGFLIIRYLASAARSN